MTKLYQKLFKSAPTASEIKKGFKEIYHENELISDKEVLKTILSVIDLTSLNTTDDKSHIIHFTGRVNSFPSKFHGLPNVAAICIYPNFVSVVKEKLTVKNVRIASVAGSFPTSQTFRYIKVTESKMAADAGADEIDVVIPVGAFLANDYATVADEIREIKSIIGDRLLKVIIESGLLNDTDQVFRASMIAMDAGADFIKTSTGKVNVSATPEAVFVMCRAISDFYAETGIKVGIKPAGGVVTPGDAVIYYNIVKYCLGSEWLSSKLFRIGASRLANNILSEIVETRTDHF